MGCLLNIAIVALALFTFAVWLAHIGEISRLRDEVRNLRQELENSDTGKIK